MKRASLPLVATVVLGVQLSGLHIGEEVLNGSHGELVRTQIVDRDLHFQKALSQELRPVIGGIVQEEHGL